MRSVIVSQTSGDPEDEELSKLTVSSHKEAKAQIPSADILSFCVSLWLTARHVDYGAQVLFDKSLSVITKVVFFRDSI